ncbi:hypothetical protein GCM10019059_43350 [Camelimonas fluminis]|nr:hypothetical protein GCM10019059_43350 [Camelimonas fluminis]
MQVSRPDMPFEFLSWNGDAKSGASIDLAGEWLRQILDADIACRSAHVSSVKVACHASGCENLDHINVEVALKNDAAVKPARIANATRPPILGTGSVAA